MLTLTVLLLAVGTVLAAAGTGLFSIVVWNAPTWDDLGFARGMATIGRWAIGVGAIMLIAREQAVGGAELAGVMVALLAGAATMLTKARLRHLAAP